MDETPRVVVLSRDCSTWAYASPGVVVHVLDLDSDDDELAQLAERDGKDFSPFERDLYISKLTKGLRVV